MSLLCRSVLLGTLPVYLGFSFSSLEILFHQFRCIYLSTFLCISELILSFLFYLKLRNLISTVFILHCFFFLIYKYDLYAFSNMWVLGVFCTLVFLCFYFGDMELLKINIFFPYSLFSYFFIETYNIVLYR